MKIPAINDVTETLLRRSLGLLTLIWVFASCFPLKLAAQPLDYERELVTLNSSTVSFEVSFFFEKTGSPKGGVLLAYGQTPQPFYLNNIAYVLARNGWSTVLVGTSITDPSEAKSAEAEQRNGTGSPQFATILDETIRFMQEEKGQYNLVLLAHGPIWGEINTYLSVPEKSKKNFQGLVMLDIRDYGSLKNLPTDLPMLDLATSRQPDRGYQQRGVEARRYKFDSYTQINLPSRLTLTSLREDHLAKRIRGWLRLHIQGMELNKDFAGG